MTRHLQSAPTAVLFGLAFLLALPACSGEVFGPVDGGGGGTGGLDEPIPAGDFGRSLGMAAYDASVSLDGSLLVIVRDFSGRRAGSFEIAVDDGGVGVARYTDLAGASSEVAYRVLDGSPTTDGAPAIVASELRAAGVILRIETLVDSGAADQAVREMSYAVAVPDGAVFPGIGGTRIAGTGAEAVLVVVEDGQPVVTEQQVLDWIANVGAGAILGDRGLMLIAAIQQDENLMAAVAEQVERLQNAAEGSGGTVEQPLRTGVQGVHTSPLCTYVLGFFSAGAGITCSVCATSVLAAPATAGGSGILAVPACTYCLVSAGIGVVDGLACARSYVNRTTEDFCSNEHVCDHEWQGGKLSDHGHGCFCECVEQRCENWCSQQATARSIPTGGSVAGACRATRGAAPCACNFDLNAYCARLHPTTYCQGARDTGAGAIECPNACGNGVLDSACPGNPSYTEQCEPGTDYGCMPGKVCDPNTCQCRDPVCGNGTKEEGEQCDFSPTGSGFGCEFGFVCNRSCQCESEGGCGNFRLDPGEPCDPTAADGACAPPMVCDAEWCTCSDPSSLCGNGTCDEELGEGDSCPQDCPSVCGDGVCNRAAGEARTCPADCGQNACCVENNGCPSEERYSCPGDCCCCPSGAVCVASSGGWTCGY